MKVINQREIASMANHWLNTPVNGYLGSGYGQDTKSLLQAPLMSLAAEGWISKAREDVFVLQSFSSDIVNLYASRSNIDKLELIFEIGDNEIQVPL